MRCAHFGKTPVLPKLSYNQLGWSVAYVPDAVAVHHIGASRSKVAPRVIYARHRGMIHYFHKHHPTHPALQEYVDWMLAALQDTNQDVIRRHLQSILPNLPAAKEKRILQALPEALGERWMNYALRLIYGSGARVVAQIARVFAELGEEAELRAAFERSIREHSATSEMLIWLCKERDGAWRELITPDLLTAILAAVERDQHRESRANRLRDLVLEDRELIGDMFAGADVGVARDTVRRLLITPAFDELTKRSLLARIVKLYPELAMMITGGQREEKAAALIVSWSSLAKRRAEHEELVKKKIPENSKEIALARSYGDLSENFEFKAAKQMQAVLMRRKAELEQALHSARGTAFENPDTSRVSIGTIVTLRGPDSGKEETYTILGAWDGAPERHIISYQTAIGQALMGHKVGDVVTLNKDEGAGTSEIVSISAAPIDQTPVEVGDPATVDAVSA